LHAAVGVSIAGDAVIAVSPGPEARQRIVDMAQASAWDPSASAAYARYAEALREPILRFNSSGCTPPPSKHSPNLAVAPSAERLCSAPWMPSCGDSIRRSRSCP
jgi:hypothetical protein